MDTKTSKPIRSICVYCGSSPGNDPAFIGAAIALGRAVASHNLRLVYGGGAKGLMGAVADSALSQGGDVLGIIPEFLLQSERGDHAPDLKGVALKTVPDMHTRKSMMFEEADAFVALPGGIGTLEELVEILTWAQLGRHKKPVGLLNTNGFWSPYVELIDHMGSAGFLHNAAQAKPLVFEQAEDVVPGMLGSS